MAEKLAPSCTELDRIGWVAPPKMGEKWDLRLISFRGYQEVEIVGGKRQTIHVVPPAGEKYAYDREDWSERITVTISPTGRSIRIYRNGQELK